jgi:translocation and assembly module TamB
VWGDPLLLSDEEAETLLEPILTGPSAKLAGKQRPLSVVKIDPTFTNGSALPTAQLTLQQQIASNLTFTYITPLNSSNTQTIRVEWALNPQWSAVAMRDENGIFSVNFLYKRQLH